jgi:glutaredoxin-like YruB-family protein
MEWIKNNEHFEEIQKSHQDFLILFFFGNFSSSAKRALEEIENFNKENKEMPVYGIDVEKIKGIHKLFEVVSVPTVVAIKNGEIIQKIEGVENSQFYTRIFSAAHPSSHKKSEKVASHRIIVYTTPTCPACRSVKTYFRTRNINFREVDVSQDSNSAQMLVKRSGQMAVPQIDIDGHLIVGFDSVKINKLLSIN